MSRDDSRLEHERDYRVVVQYLQDIVTKVRQSVAQRQIRTPADFIIVIETLRLCGVSMAEAGNALNVAPALVHNWQNGQQLPPPTEYQRLAELTCELLRTHLIHYAGRKWALL